jgi:hypothetical protein
LTDRINFSNLIESTKDPEAQGTLFVGAASHRRKLIQNISKDRGTFVFYLHRTDGGEPTRRGRLRRSSLPPASC